MGRSWEFRVRVRVTVTVTVCSSFTRPGHSGCQRRGGGRAAVMRCSYPNVSRVSWRSFWRVYLSHVEA